MVSLWYLILCRECGILLSSLGLLLWWWSLIALVIIITPFVSTTFSWFWYDLYPILYLALVLSLWYLIQCRECGILLSSYELLLWWWSLIALIVIITPFVSTAFSWFWYDLYPFLYLALVLSLQLSGGASVYVC